MALSLTQHKEKAARLPLNLRFSIFSGGGSIGIYISKNLIVGTFHTVGTGRDLSLHHDRPLNYDRHLFIHIHHLHRFIHQTSHVGRVSASVTRPTALPTVKRKQFVWSAELQFSVLKQLKLFYSKHTELTSTQLNSTWHE